MSEEGTRDARAPIAVTTAAILAVGVFVPGWAPAQSPMPIEPPDTQLPPVDQVVGTIQERAGSLQPPVVAPRPVAPEPRAQPPRSAPQQTTDPAPADRPPAERPARESAPHQPSATKVLDPEPDFTAGSAPPQEAASEPAESGKQAKQQPVDGAKPDDERAAESEQAASADSAQPSTGSDRPSATAIERIVDVVPMPLKVALALLVALLVLAIAGARRTQHRLALAERRAATDALTGLPNRRHADEVIERLLAAARRNGRSLAVVLFDLDHFKAINDRFGHALGDNALRAAAEATRGLLRGSDHVARFGGEEFLVLLPETGPDAAVIVAEKLRSRIAQLEVAGLDGGLTASFGVAGYPDHGIGAEELLQAADQALYSAKEAGRNRVETAMELQGDDASVAALPRRALVATPRVNEIERYA